MSSNEHEKFISTYEKHRFYGIFPITTIILLVSIFGIFGNFNIVWASCRKKSLRSNCNILIASAAFSDIFHQLSHFILAYHLFTGNTFITLEKCFWLQLIPIFWMNFGTFVVLSIGIDRLISVMFPLGYKLLEPKSYLFVMFIIPVGFGIWMTLIAYIGMLENKKTKVICLIAESYHVSAKDDWLHIVLLVNSMIIIVYSGVWIIIKFKKGKMDKRILRSLTVIVFLVLFGWFSGALGVSICLELKWNEEDLFKAQMYIGTLINLSISFNYPVYMYFCKRYKIAFLEQLKLLKIRNHFIQRTSIVTIQSRVHPTISTLSRLSNISN